MFSKLAKDHPGMRLYLKTIDEITVISRWIRRQIVKRKNMRISERSQDRLPITTLFGSDASICPNFSHVSKACHLEGMRGAGRSLPRRPSWLRCTLHYLVCL